MFFKKTKSASPVEKLTGSIKVFIHINTKEAEERLSNEILYLPNFGLTFQYEIFSIFIVDYCITMKIKDTELKDSILESFYNKWNTYFSDEQFRILKIKLDKYAQILRKNKEWPTIIKDLGFTFSQNVLKKVDLILVSRLSLEYSLLKTEVEKLIDESKLNKDN